MRQLGFHLLDMRFSPHHHTRGNVYGIARTYLREIRSTLNTYFFPKY